MRAPRVMISFAGLVPLVGLPLVVAAPAIVRGEAPSLIALGQAIVTAIGVFAVWIGVAPMGRS